MAFVQVKTAVVDRTDGTKVLELMEFIIGSESDLSGLPDCAPGSLAYTGDMSYVAMYDGTQWNTVKGGD